MNASLAASSSSAASGSGSCSPAATAPLSSELVSEIADAAPARSGGADPMISLG
jgi:hypothetical protein